MKEKREVESFDIDNKGRLRPYVLFAFLLNSAWRHASSVGFGYHDLERRKLMWVLSEFQLCIAKEACGEMNYALRPGANVSKDSMPCVTLPSTRKAGTRLPSPVEPG